MSILLLSTGGGGGNILRSLKTLFARDVAIAQNTDAAYAERLRNAVTARFLDTNEFSLAQVPADEQLLIGKETTHGLGSRHDPSLAARALEESREHIISLIDSYSIVVIIGTGGKGTGAGTMFPLAEIVRRQNKLVLPVFVRPSFERHEVDKRRYDHALHVARQFDDDKIRLVEILNDHAYSDRDPQPQSVVWERMNLPIARGLRGLIYVLWDLSEIDPSDLSILFAGNGRMRIGFGEIDPLPGHDPSDEQIRQAVDACWQNPFCAFNKLPGTSLVCIQGDWSNLADAKIKSEIASRALGNVPDARYNPLYARATESPRPWGVTALFTEYTGTHVPMPLVWTGRPDQVKGQGSEGKSKESPDAAQPIISDLAVAVAPADDRAAAPRFATIGDLARAINRLDPAALEIAAGESSPDILVDGPVVRKLISAVWFRSVVPKLSASWRDRLLDTLVNTAVIPNHVMSRGRQSFRLADASYDDLRAIAGNTTVSAATGADLYLVLAVMSLWGEDARQRLQFVDMVTPERTSRLGALFS